MLPELEGLSYGERLRLFSLECWKLRGDLIDVYKIMKDMDRDLAQAALGVLPQHLEVSALDILHLRAIWESRNHHSSVNHDLGIGSDVVILKHLYSQVAEVCTLEVVPQAVE
eukprot:g40881.t1